MRYGMKDISAIFQFPFIAESDKKFSAEWFFILSQLIFQSESSEMKHDWKMPETSFSL